MAKIPIYWNGHVSSAEAQDALDRCFRRVIGIREIANQPASVLIGGKVKPSRVVTYTVRLKPGQDLKTELSRVAQELDLKAACILSGVGSLKKLSLRLSGLKTATEFQGDWEIVSITGTLSAQAMHVHLSASGSEGKTIGGHLMEGNPVFTTCELVLLEQLDLEYHREEDPTYGYKELVVRPRP